ncbi:hypothetical protein QZH41_009409 [Actinostola sp. cb2023]|nr:hypothetical protein QZH41_009409 [Actinostola sp. cb2023]
MINLLCCFRNDGHPIRLNAEFHLDLNWWLQFLETWNGVSFWLYPGMSAVPTMEVTSDAAGALGYGAYFNHEWFNGLWFACLPTAGSVGPTVTDPNTKSSVGGSHFASLELRCRELLLQGLAPSTRRSYATGQKRFINFCTQLGKSGEPLTRVLLTKWLRDIMTAAKIPGNYSSHSFRIGAATVAARNGVPDHLIQTLGRWSSNAYKGYIRTPVEALASTSVQLT